jgi:hypothetical protein
LDTTRSNEGVHTFFDDVAILSCGLLLITSTIPHTQTKTGILKLTP